MGNWRTVNIIGTCDAADVEALKAVTYYDRRTYETFHCLTRTDGLMSLGEWVAERIDAKGNLAERGYDVEDIAHQLEELVRVAPSLTIKVHCGGDYESPTCINTISVSNGTVVIGPPEVSELDTPSEDQVQNHFWSQILHQR